MTRNDWIILCLAYIVGLLSTNLISSSSDFTTQQLWWLVGSIGLSIILAIVLLRPLKSRIWLGAAIVAILAVWYFQLRIPQPNNNDISYRVTASERELVTVAGKVLTEPRLNDRNRLKFVLQATEVDNEAVSGKLYVTLPLLQGTGIYPGKQIELRGILYLPQAASNLGGFDFQAYLARQGIFAGIQGFKTISQGYSESVWGWWKIRQRIVRSQLRGLGSPVGQLVSSMVLGRKAVDLPGDIRDCFIEAGLAHVLAASGFHVSLLLGIILKLTDRFAAKPRLAVGMTTLIVYLGLTGIQASVLRACLMGSAVLIALAMDTKVKPLGSLLLAATIILLFNPLFISDLGFQLSFLATFGLIVTLPALQTKLDWLPLTVATLVAVPLAASVWVLPLISYEFNTIATYSIIVNIVCTPLITLISLGGMISAIAALIIPALGSAIASLLLYPTLLLITATKFFTSLPASTWAVGQISVWVLFIIYSLMVLVWLSRWWNKRWWLALLLIVASIAITIFNNSARLQIAVLAAKSSQIIVIQDRGTVILINSGKSDRSKYTVLPYLAQQGINQIDYAIAFDEGSNSEIAWSQIVKAVAVKSIIPVQSQYLWHYNEHFSSERAIITDSVRLSIDENLAAIDLQIEDHTWLIIAQTSNNRPSSEIEQYIKQHDLQSQHPILVWSGDIAPMWLELLQPQIAIASKNLKPKISQQLRQKQIVLHNTAEEGMIRWTPKTKFIRQETFDRD